MFLTKPSIKHYQKWSFCNKLLCRNLIQLFWLWETTRHVQLMPEDYSMDITISRPRKSNDSKFSIKKTCLLLARHFIWCCRNSEKTHTWKRFWKYFIQHWSPQKQKTRIRKKEILWSPSTILTNLMMTLPGNALFERYQVSLLGFLECGGHKEMCSSWQGISSPNVLVQTMILEHWRVA